jgi:hypothetical protein
LNGIKARLEQNVEYTFTSKLTPNGRRLDTLDFKQDNTWNQAITTWKLVWQLYPVVTSYGEATCKMNVEEVHIIASPTDHTPPPAAGGSTSGSNSSSSGTNGWMVFGILVIVGAFIGLVTLLFIRNRNKRRRMAAAKTLYGSQRLGLSNDERDPFSDNSAVEHYRGNETDRVPLSNYN